MVLPVRFGSRLIDDTRELLGLPGDMVKLTNVAGNTLTVDPSSASSTSATAWSALLVNPRVRRWDQTANADVSLTSDGTVLVTEKTASASDWIPLEDGVQVQFSPVGGNYRTGDYWLIPARVATGNIEWPPKTTTPDSRS